MKLQFVVNLATMLVIISLSLTGCDGGSGNLTPRYDISGMWAFTLSPSQEALVKDPQATPADHEGVELVQDGYRLTGESEHFTFDGEYVTEDILELRVRSKYDQEPSEHISEMNLSVVDINTLEGTGIFYDGDNVSSETSDGSYIATAVRMPADTARRSFRDSTSVETVLCSVFEKIPGPVIGQLTGGSYKPMASCYPNKKGSGYYVFGQTGPGSIYPYWTQTAYVPLQWSHCNTAVYKFAISNGDDIEYSQAFMDWLRGQQALLELLSQLGGWWWSSVDDAISDVEDFYEKYGKFAISLGTNTSDDMIMIIIHYTDSNNPPMFNHMFITALQVGLEKLTSSTVVPVNCPSEGGVELGVELLRGVSLLDTCSTPFLFSYLLGTIKVNYE